MSDECRECGLSINPFKQLSQEDIDNLKEHASVEDKCEFCLLDIQGMIEFPS